MWWPVSAAANAEAEIAAAGYPQMRLFQVEQTISYEPVDDVAGSWQVCSPETGRLARNEPNLVNGQGLPASPYRTRPLKGGVRVEEVEWGAR